MFLKHHQPLNKEKSMSSLHRFLKQQPREISTLIRLSMHGSHMKSPPRMATYSLCSGYLNEIQPWEIIKVFSGILGSELTSSIISDLQARFQITNRYSSSTWSTLDLMCGLIPTEVRPFVKSIWLLILNHSNIGTFHWMSKLTMTCQQL